MSVRAEQLEDWIGAEAVDPGGEKLGKVSDVYFHDGRPVIVEIRSGLAGRRHFLAALAGATVSTKQLHLRSADTVPTDGGLDIGALEQLAAHDERLRELTPEELESDTEREERLRRAEEAAAQAAKLDAEAARRGEEARVAAERAARATAAQHDADAVQHDAEQRAREARRAAEELGR